jgi:hypothetical protein
MSATFPITEPADCRPAASGRFPGLRWTAGRHFEPEKFSGPRPCVFMGAPFRTLTAPAPDFWTAPDSGSLMLRPDSGSLKFRPDSGSLKIRPDSGRLMLRPGSIPRVFSKKALKEPWLLCPFLRFRISQEKLTSPFPSRPDPAGRLPAWAMEKRPLALRRLRCPACRRIRRPSCRP